MANLIEYVDELVQEVGPRPAGTQQEHQAAELIAARLDEFGMQVDIEEFSCTRNTGWVRALYYALCVGGAAVGIFLASFQILGILLVIVGAILMFLDYFGKNPLFSLFKNSLSQNVIARYLPPGVEPSSRTRKVIVLAHYDSARAMVQAAPLLVAHYALLRRVIRAAMVVLVILMLLALIPFPAIVLTIITVLTGIAAAVVLLALVAEIINFFMPYNQGANCNGSSVGVLYGLAQILSSGTDVAALRGAFAQDARGGATREQQERAGRSSRGRRAGGAVAGAAGAAAAAGVAGGAAGARRGRAGAAAAGKTKGGAGGLLSRLQGVIRPQVNQQAPDEGSGHELRGNRELRVYPRDATPGERLGQTAQPPQVAQTARAGEAGGAGEAARADGPLPGNEALSLSRGTESTVQSVGDNLVNPFISRRPPLSKIEELNQAREEERKQRLEEQRKQEQAEQERTEKGMPAWFVQAKKNAEKKAERTRHSTDGAEVVRSRFADVPVSGRALKGDEEADEDEAAAAAPAAEAADVAMGVEQDAATVEQGTVAPAAPAPAPAAPGAPAAPRGANAGTHLDVTAGLPPIDGAQVLYPAAKAQMLQPTLGQPPAAQPPAAPQAGFELDAAANRRAAVPVTAALDLSGLDRQAFKVLPGEEDDRGAVIVPTHTAPAVPTQGAPAPAVPTHTAPAPGIAAREVTPSFLGGANTPGRTRDGSAARFAAGDAAFEGTEEELSAFVNGSPQAGSAHATPQAPRQAGSRQAALRNRLRGLPNVSADGTGGIPAQQATLDTELVTKEELFSEQDSLVSATGAFVPLGTTGVMKPIGEDLLSYHDGEEIYVPDADDAAISGHYSKTGEYSEPEMVNIPNSRVKSFLGSVGDRLSGKKKERLDDSPASWLGVDEKFDARKEGSQIGSWDNFNEDDDEGWSGGAFGGANPEENVKAMMGLSRELLNKEVWLVALGASESKHAGLANLFANHGSELKSGLFVNLLGVGIGDLVFTVSEGNYRPAQTDHRMQSLITSAAQNMDIPIAPATFSAFSTDGTEALRYGGRAISLMGLGDQTPVNWRWSDDEVSRLTESNMVDVAALVIEMIKNS